MNRRGRCPYDLALIGRIDVWKTSKGTYVDTLRSLARAYGVEDRVKFIGFVPHEELFPYYRGAHLFVQPSLYETFGKTVIEAMACGTPVVGADIGATPEVMGGAGLLFEPLSSDDLCAKMERMLADQTLRARCAQQGLEHAQQFTFNKQASGLIEAFRAATASC